MLGPERCAHRSFVSQLGKKRDGVCAIEATLYEIDSNILETLSATMRKCQRACGLAGIRFSFTIHEADFIQEMAASLGGDLFGSTPPAFDAAIVNPP